MSVMGYSRGYQIRWVEEENRWIYEDDGTTHDEKPRPCKKCGKIFKFNKPDTCLGKLPGVKNACCGHGVRSESYIEFTNGVIIKDFVIARY